MLGNFVLQFTLLTFESQIFHIFIFAIFNFPQYTSVMNVLRNLFTRINTKEYNELLNVQL